jgi:small multidrug resistance family-3 protein
MKTIMLFMAAAVAEIVGCYAFWLWFRLNRSAGFGAMGVAALITFAWLLTRIDMNYAGRAYAAYGGIYIAASLLWLWLVEGVKPDRWDSVGVAICLVGVGVMVIAPRGDSAAPL